MFWKIFDQKTKVASELLSRLNISHKRAHVLTQFKDIQGLFNSRLIKVPPMNSFIKAMKKQTFSIDYIIKCAVLTHFFLQTFHKDQIASLRDFIAHLTCRLKEIGQSIGYILATEVFKAEVLKTAMASLPTQSDQVTQGKEKFILKQIVVPYLSYLMKTTAIKEETIREAQLQNHQIWRLVNLLKMISAITSKFMLIGRYYFEDYAAIVILLSEVLSIDICDYVAQINEYLRRQSRMLSPSSDRAEDKQEVNDFLRLLQEMGWLNEKLNHFFLGKYFYQFLRHIKQPEWLDSNSQQFDSLFSYKR